MRRARTDVNVCGYGCVGRAAIHLMIDLSDKTILVVDDESHAERELVRILSAGSFGRVLSTTDSSTVLELCERHRPDFLVLDLTMPDPDGFALLESLAERMRGESPLRVAILTGHEHPAIERRAIALGAACVVSKTLPRDELIAQLERVFSSPAPDDRSPRVTVRGVREARIVVIDDSPINLRVIERNLANAGFTRVDTFTEPSEALESCIADGADLVLLDLHLPGVDGFEVLDRLKIALSATPVLVFSGYITDAIRERVTTAGAAVALEKSAIGPELTTHIERLVLEGADD